MSAPLSAPALALSGYAALQRRTREVLEVAAPEDRLSRTVDLAIISLISLNLVVLILETVQPLRAAHGRLFAAIDAASILLFTAEYLLRLWSAPASPRFAGAVRGRLRYVASPTAIVDLLAVLPFWLPFVGIDLRALRTLRLLRMLRVARLGRYSLALQTLGRVIAAKKEELVVTLSLGGLLLLAASTLIYVVESSAQPEAFGSIPTAMWWAVSTLTTVGYGDVYPITAVGRVLGGVVAVLGIGLFALPTGVLGAAFVEELGKKRRGRSRCPHCGGELE